MSIISDLKHDFAAVVNNSQDIKNSKNLSTACQWGKVTVVAAAIAIAVTGLFSGPIGMFFAGFALLALVDGYKMLDNVQTIADQGSIGRTLGSVSSSLQGRSYDHVTRGTLFARPILGLVS
jgi:hypothetical protein